MADTILGEVGFWPRGNWNAETAYPFLSLVAYNGGSYVARQDVPAGTALTDESYWMPISDTRETVRELIEQHPEWVTTVEDGSITEAKLEAQLAAKVNSIDGVSARLHATETAVSQQQGNIDTLGNRVDELISGGTPPEGELADIRVGYDGTTYGSAGAAVRAQAEANAADIGELYDGVFGEPFGVKNLTPASDEESWESSDHSWGASGINGWIRIVGTVPSTVDRHLIMTNGYALIKQTTAAFTKIVDPGTYRFRIEHRGHYSGAFVKQARWTYTNYTSENRSWIYDGDVITFTAPAMVGLYAQHSTDYGTTDDYTEVRYSFIPIVVEDELARAEIKVIDDKIKNVSADKIESAYDFSQRNIELASMTDGQLQQIRLEYTETFSRFAVQDGQIVEEPISLMGTKYIKCPKFLAFHFQDSVSRAYVYFYDLVDGSFVPRWDICDFTASTGVKNYCSKAMTYNRVIAIPDDVYMRVALDAEKGGKPIELYAWSGTHFGTNISAMTYTPDLDDASLADINYKYNHPSIIIPGSARYLLLNGWQVLRVVGIVSGVGRSLVPIYGDYLPSLGFIKLPEGYHHFRIIIGNAEWTSAPQHPTTGSFVPGTNLNDAVSIVYRADNTVIASGLAEQVIKRAASIAGIRWTCRKSAQIANGDSAKTFKKDCEYAGIPYSSKWSEPHFFGWHVSKHTFLNAANDVRSKFYSETDRSGKSYGYGLVCSSYACLAAGWPYPVTTACFLRDPQIQRRKSSQPEIGAVMHSGNDHGHCLIPELFGVGNDCRYYSIYECVSPVTLNRTLSDYQVGTINNTRFYDYLWGYPWVCHHNDESILRDGNAATARWAPYNIFDGTITNGTARPYRGDRSVCTNLDPEAVSGGGVKVNIYSDTATTLYCKRMSYNASTGTFSDYGSAPVSYQISGETAYIPISSLVDGGFYGVYTDADETMEFFEYHFVEEQHYTDGEDEIFPPAGEFWYMGFWQSYTVSGNTEIIPYIPEGSKYRYSDYRKPDSYQASYCDGNVFYKGVLGAYSAPLICDNKVTA